MKGWRLREQRGGGRSLLDMTKVCVRFPQMLSLPPSYSVAVQKGFTSGCNSREPSDSEPGRGQ